MDTPFPTQAFCVACRRAVPATVSESEGHLYLTRTCPVCGEARTLIEHDAALYARWEAHRRSHVAPERTQTAAVRGCPLDCGLCPAHRQKSCVVLLEVTDACNLNCPVCYAGAGESASHLSLETVRTMLEGAVAAAAGRPEILQISGGEPTCHPQILEILRIAKSLPFKYVMLNTNGFALQDGSLDLASLAALGPGFEVYLQFDGLDDDVYRAFRGRPLLAEKRRALEALAHHGIPATLVATLRRGVNVETVGDLLRFGLAHPAVRGVNFQCEARFGRTPADAAAGDRVTQTEVVNLLAHQAPDILGTEDFMPLACGLASLVHLERTSDTWRPIPRAFADAWRGNPLTATLEELVAAGKGMCACRSGWLETLLASLPENAMAGPVEARSRLVHERFFHVSVASFLDATNFDLNRACRECTHVLQPDGRKIPFSAYNTIHRRPRVQLGG